MPLRQMGEAVDLKAAIPNLKMRGGMQAYDQALRTRLQAVTGLSEPANEASAMNAMRRQQEAYQQRLAQLNATNNTGAGGPVGSASAQRQGNGAWISPVTGRISFGYGAPYSRHNQRVTGSATHRGTDWGVAAGTPIYAPSGGTLLSAGWGNTGFGNEIRMNFNEGFGGIFGHLSKFAPGLKPGMRITPGMLLGYVGHSGNAQGDHLHFETRYDLNKPGTAFDPSSWFGW